MAGNANSGLRKPVALKLYQGNRSKVAKTKLREVAFRPGAADCPGWMPELGREYWAHLVHEIGHIPGLLQATDRGVLEQVCKKYAEWREFTEFCDKNGWTYEHEQHYIDMNGTPAVKKYPKPRPEARFAKEAGAEFARLRGELGLSPSHRSRLALPSSPESKEGLLDSDA